MKAFFVVLSPMLRDVEILAISPLYILILYLQPPPLLVAELGDYLGLESFHLFFHKLHVRVFTKSQITISTIQSV